MSARQSSVSECCLLENKGGKANRGGLITKPEINHEVSLDLGKMIRPPNASTPRASSITQC